MKAFIITRIGDIFLIFSLFILYDQLGTLNFHDLALLVPKKIAEDPLIMKWATLMLLFGAVGKSAQLPLQTWLADAMAGPTPVSALIHATTMVTAGVYLITRMHDLFLNVPEILHLVGIIGTVTLLLAGFAALVQINIKRILAYSTMSQIGYMFLAMGVQAWNAAIFHLIIHSFFKALLFLSSGSVIIACYHEQNIFKMGGLYKLIPLVYICFLIGGAALSALPLVTAGFYSKDEILWGAFVNGYQILSLLGLIGTFLTSIYTFRMIFIIFHGKIQINASLCQDTNHNLPLIILSILSTSISTWIIPLSTGILPTSEFTSNGKLTFELISGVISIIGITLATVSWFYRFQLVNKIIISVPFRFLSIFCYHAWVFDWLYDKIFVKPYLIVAHFLVHDPLNKLMNIPAILVHLIGRSLLVSENGRLRWYAMSIMLGTLIILVLLIFV